jgi:cell fate (sporulation/competence/biofilm development) regulator YlbF (YheA/YmcA/DUF963 family)
MVYDQVYVLAKQLSSSEEFQSFKKAKDAALANETNAALLKEYKKLSMQAQAHMMSGNALSAEMTEKLQKLYGILQLSPECTAYLMAEYNFNRMMGDVYKILGDAVELDLDFLKE